MNTLTNHIPDEILKENVPLKKFLGVLEEMLKVEKSEIRNYVANYMYPLVYDIRIMRRYVDEWRAEYTEQSSRICLDCLYRNYFEIYSRKGTYIGLQKLLRCLFAVDTYPEITIEEYNMGKPLILFDDVRPYDWLPEGQDLANELNAPAGEEIWCPTLLDDTWSHTIATLTITVSGLGYTPTAEFLQFINSVIVLYLPMVSSELVSIDLNII